MRAGKAAATKTNSEARNTALFLRMCAAGDVVGVSMCLERGADPNAVDSEGVSFLLTLPHFTWPFTAVTSKPSMMSFMQAPIPMLKIA